MRTLLEEVTAFEKSGAYTFRVEVASRTPQTVTYHGFAVERHAPPAYWALLAGEAIQNLRSSLGHVVWAANTHRTVQTGFPIALASSSFDDRSTSMLRGVSDEMRNAIEKAQPYRTAPDAPQEAMLERLRVLSNLDKHRTLAAVATAVQHEGVGVSHGVAIAWTMYATGRPMGHGKTHISSFTATSDLALGDLVLELMFDYEVRIEGRSMTALKGIVHELHHVLYECETGEPLSPSAPSPL